MKMRLRQSSFILSPARKMLSDLLRMILLFFLILPVLTSLSAAPAGPASDNSPRIARGPAPPEVVFLVEQPLSAPAAYALEALEAALDNRGIAWTRDSGAGAARRIIVGIPSFSPVLKALLSQGRMELADQPESLSVKRLLDSGRDTLAVAGRDERGLMYALLETARQIEHAEPGTDWYQAVREISESPRVPLRSMSVLLHSEDCEKEWYYSRDYWRSYFAMLAENRWNAFNLVFSHQTAYLSPLYAFHVKVEEHPEVYAIGLTEAERVRNLRMLRFISSLAAERGIDFTIGIWQQIAWESKNQGSRQETMVAGLTRANMHSYVYHALKKLLGECPGIKTVQLRINHESGIDYDEQTEFFTNSVFRAIKDCGRPVRLESRNVGLLRETVEASLAMDVPIRISHKFWGEHMVFPYHPTRLMWTYSYGDWLKHPQRYQNMYHVWSLGSHRLLLWGDPDYVRRFAPTTTFQNADGFEICAPLSQKGYGNPPGNWRIFRDREREFFQWEFQRYWSTYALFGRLTYNPEESDEFWLREMRRRFGREAAEPISAAYRAASKVVMLILGAASPDYNMNIWAEKDMGGLINFYLHFKSFNEPRISSFLEHVDNLIEGESSAKVTPEQTADRLEAIAAEVKAQIARADDLVTQPNKEYWATRKDFQILAGMSSYFADKIRATCRLGFYYRLGDYTQLRAAIAHAKKALDAWKELSAVAEEIYSPDLIMGRGSTGHWKDNIAFVEDDLHQLLHQDELFKLLENFDYGFDFGPDDFAATTAGFIPWYANNYYVEHRFKGVSPRSLYSTQNGFGWSTRVELTAEQPPRVNRAVWRAAKAEYVDQIPSHVLFKDFVQGTDPAIFFVDLPEGHYQATLLITDQGAGPRDHGPMSISVVERFGERPILTDQVVKPGETIVKRFNFNMVGSRYSNFRLKLSAAPGADYILTGLTFTRIEPHIAHLPVRTSRPGEDIVIRAGVTLPPQVLQPVKDSLSIARGTTSTVEPPDQITFVRLSFSTDSGRTYRRVPMTPLTGFVYEAVIPGAELPGGELRYVIEAGDSIGQTIPFPDDGPLGTILCRITDDAAPPHVIHDPVTEWNLGRDLIIRAEVEDRSAIDRVMLHYRPTRQALEYSRVDMLPDETGRYTAVIPGEAFTREFDLIYFIEAIDEFGNGCFFPEPEREDPHLVVKVRR